METNDKELFWIYNLKILYENENYLRFMPSTSMSRYEKFNAITRLCFYMIILSIIFSANSIWYQIPIIIILLLIILVHLNILQEKKNNDDSVLTLSSEVKNISNENNFIEAGYYDPNNKLTFPSDFKKRNNKKVCRMPTTDNPYMNPEVFDASKYSQPLACNADDDDIDDLNKKITNSFNDQLFRDVSDLYNIKNSQRQYYTISGNKTPDTVGFANWLYGNMPSCKSNQSDCHRYDNLVQSRPLITK